MAFPYSHGDGSGGGEGAATYRQRRCGHVAAQNHPEIASLGFGEDRIVCCFFNCFFDIYQIRNVVECFLLKQKHRQQRKRSIEQEEQKQPDDRGKRGGGRAVASQRHSVACRTRTKSSSTFTTAS